MYTMSESEFLARRFVYGLVMSVAVSALFFIVMRAVGNALPGGSWSQFLSLGSQMPSPVSADFTTDWLKFALLGTLTCALSAGWLNFILPAAYWQMKEGYSITRTTVIFRLLAVVYAIVGGIFAAFVAVASGDSIFIVAIAGGIAVPLAPAAAMAGLLFTAAFNRPFLYAVPAALVFLLLVRFVG